MFVSAMTMAMVLSAAGAVQPSPTPPVEYALPPSPYPPPPAMPTDGSSGPVRARSNLNSYFSLDDYPAAALRQGAEGTVAVDLVISPEGRIIACTVIGSSGFSALDQATCRILRSRARYTPTRDAGGTPVSGTDRGRVTWRLPPAPPPPTPAGFSPPPPPGFNPGPPILLPGPRLCLPETAPPSAPFNACFAPSDYPYAAWQAGEQGIVGVRVVMALNPAERRCEVTEPSGSAILDRETCAMLGRRAIATQDGLTVSGRVAWVRPERMPPDRRRPILTYFTADDYPAAALRANDQGEVSFILDVGVNGRATACRIARSSGSESLDAQTCRIARLRTRFLPARDAERRAVPGTHEDRVTWRLPDE